MLDKSFVDALQFFIVDKLSFPCLLCLPDSQNHCTLYLKIETAAPYVTFLIDSKMALNQKYAHKTEHSIVPRLNKLNLLDNFCTSDI